jgi:hypothetical protein
MMTMFLLNVLLAALFWLAYTLVPLWLVAKHPKPAAARPPRPELTHRTARY